MNVVPLILPTNYKDIYCQRMYEFRKSSKGKPLLLNGIEGMLDGESTVRKGAMKNGFYWTSWNWSHFGNVCYNI